MKVISKRGLAKTIFRSIGVCLRAIWVKAFCFAPLHLFRREGGREQRCQPPVVGIHSSNTGQNFVLLCDHIANFRNNKSDESSDQMTTHQERWGKWRFQWHLKSQN